MARDSIKKGFKYGKCIVLLNQICNERETNGEHCLGFISKYGWWCGYPAMVFI